MRALVQRVKHCSVTIDGNPYSYIGNGMLILLGIKNGDKIEDAAYLANRSAALRIFDDSNGKMNLSIEDVQGEAMVVSQFTLYGNITKGNRPSFIDAAPPEIANVLYEEFNNYLRKLLGGQKIKTGVFRAMMDVELVNDGPVTIMLESVNNA